MYLRLNAAGEEIMGFRVEEHHCNNLMNAHGGMLMTFADIAWGRIMPMAPGTQWVTVRLLCDFVSGAQHGEWIESRAELIGETEGLYTVRGRIVCDDRTIVTGTGTYKIIERRKGHPPMGLPPGLTQAQGARHQRGD